MALSAFGASAETDPVTVAASLRQAGDARNFFQQWLGLLVSRTPGLHTALLLSLDDAGALAPAAMWPETMVDVSELAGPAQRCVEQGGDVVVALADGPRGAARTALATPVLVDERIVAAVVLVSARTGEADTRRLLADIAWGSGWIAALHRQRQGMAQAAGSTRMQHALDMLALLAAHDRVDDACAAMAAELARVSQCERVAVGLVDGRRVRLSSLSHAAWFERRSALAVALEAAMGEAIEQRATLSWPDSDGADRGLITNAQRALGRGADGADTASADDLAVLTVPIVAGSRAVGAVTWQLTMPRSPGPGQPAVSAEFIAQAQALAIVLAPLLARLADQSRWWAGRGPAALGRGWALMRDPRRPGFAVSTLAGLALLAGVTLVDTTWRVPARASLEGRFQRVIAAPFDGFVLEAPARAGQTVSRGTLLARLDDRDLNLERARLLAELGQQRNKRDEALARHDRAELGVQSAQVAETEARLAQVDERLAHTRIEAPFDGVLVSGDLSQNLGAPVEQGRTLFELAPLQGYRVALKVDERDIRELRPGQHGELVLAGLAGDRLAFTVRQISVASVEDGQNVFRVEADLQTPDPRLRPGMEGVGKIDAGAHPLLWIWTHRFVDWLRLAWWRHVA